ncbi:MAG: MerR family transcriptional regulator [Syntrophomonadaceae bacterium]
MTREYRIGELAREADVTKRTIHYYIGRGLLPPPEGAGVGSSYKEEHLVKLNLIKKLQEQYLPLVRIRDIVAALNLDEARQLLAQPGSWNGFVFKGYDSEEPMEAGKVKNSKSTENNPVNHTVRAEGRASSYARLELGMGMELHFPSELLQKDPALISSIEKYVHRLIDEK